MSDQKPPADAPIKISRPDPTPSRAAYDRERWICLARSPRRLFNYMKFLLADRRSVDVSYLPTRMDIENVSRCNFRCTMCQVSEWPKGQRADDMTLADFKRLLDEQYGLVEIKIQGFGEPLLMGDDFFEMIRYARARRIWTRTTTNASLLHLKDNYRKLVDSGINEVQISIDGADAAIFEKIRVGSVFDTVKKNCKLINDYAASKGIECTKAWTVVQRDNWHQLRDLVHLAHELGFKSQAFSFDIGDFGDPEWHKRNQAVTMELDPQLPYELTALGQSLGIKVGIWNVTQQFSLDDKSRMCPWPFERTYISSDMQIVPCPIGDPRRMNFGNAKDLKDNWNGKKLRGFRRAHLQGKLPAICRTCYEKRKPD